VHRTLGSSPRALRASRARGDEANKQSSQLRNGSLGAGFWEVNATEVDHAAPAREN